MNRSLKSRKKRSDPSENIPPKCEPYTGHFSLAICSTYSAIPVLKNHYYCATSAAIPPPPCTPRAPQPHAAPPVAVVPGYDMNFLLALIIDDRA